MIALEATVRDVQSARRMAFLRRHTRAVLAIVAGVAVSALTYQPPF